MDLKEAQLYLTLDPHYLSTGINQVAAKAFIEGYSQGIRDAAEIVKTEEEPTIETLPKEALDLFLISPAHSMIGSVVATKKNIESRMLSLLPPPLDAKEENEKLKATISEMQIQHSKGFYTPAHEAERKALRILCDELTEALKSALHWLEQIGGVDIESHNRALQKYQAFKGEEKK